jgi:hypothetical protein
VLDLAGVKLAPLETLWPSVADLQVGKEFPRLFVQIRNVLPVVAFGTVFPVVKPELFTLCVVRVFPLLL